jgi:ComF family protein
MGFLEWLYPRRCLGCGRQGKYFCGRCVKTIDFSDECFNNHLSLFCYRGIIREAVKKLKFHWLKDVMVEFKPLIGRALDKKLNQPNTELFRKFLKLKPAVQPLPLFWFRRNWRGYNQAALIARIVAETLNLKLIDCLKRVKLTAPQSRLDRRRRLTNVRQIFQVKPVVLPPAVLLVDDVWTTGATLTEAMKALQAAGVKNVWGLTLAR